MFMTLLLLCVLFLFTFLPNAHAQVYCECDFGNSGYQAKGTRAACQALTWGTKKCEIRFGATTYDESIVKKVLPKVNYDGLRSAGFRVTQQYLAALYNNNISFMIDVGFIKHAIPLFIRATYLSVSIPEIPISLLRRVDKNIMVFFNNKTATVRNTFTGKISKNEYKQGTTKFIIGKGYVIISEGNLKIISIIFR